MQLIVSISANFEKENLISQGILKLYQHSLILYSVQYEDKDSYITTDIDNVSLDSRNSCVKFIEIDQNNQYETYYFKIQDRRHFQLFIETLKTCQETTNLSLNLNSNFKSLYFNTIYPEGSYGNIQQRLDDRLIVFQSQSSKQLTNLIKRFDHQKHITTESNEKKDKPLPKEECFYCSKKDTSSNGSMMIHPFVSVDLHNNPIYICNSCYDAWNQYRTIAENDNSLLLPEESNEEICALCSCSPDFLTLCSECPRSYCDFCLKRIISEDNFQEIKQNSDSTWSCMVCVNKINLKPLIMNKNWRTQNSRESLKILSNVDKCSSKGSNKSYSTKETSKHDSQLDSFYSPNNNKRKRKKGLSDILSNQTSTDKLDEVYYFGQYIQSLEVYFSGLFAKKSNKSKQKFSYPTEDVCFLCKDGGDLIECDWTNRTYHSDFSSAVFDCKCSKVYHSYCLNFEVKENVDWTCPRHFCSSCGSKQLEYMCLFCPISYCAACPLLNGEKVRSSILLVVVIIIFNSFL